MLYRLNRFVWRVRRRLAYQKYMHSPQWAAVRAAVMKRARGRCEHEGCEAKARDIHHMTYPRDLFDTAPRHCQALCKRHHARADKKRARLNRQRWKARLTK